MFILLYKQIWKDLKNNDDFILINISRLRLFKIIQIIETPKTYLSKN